MRKKAEWYKSLLIIAFSALITMIPFEAHAEGGEYTIHSYSQFRNMFAKEDSMFAIVFNKIVSIAWSVGLLLNGFAFVMLMIALIINAGKLGSYKSNPQQRQEAYNGMIHTAINSALLGAAPLIFGTVMKFYTGQ